MKQCKAFGCIAPVALDSSADFCTACLGRLQEAAPVSNNTSMSLKYPKYFKDFSDVSEADVYLIHDRFRIDDSSGAIQHASKKLLLSGVRTGGKSKYQDIKEARDTLNRWLEINAHQKQDT